MTLKESLVVRKRIALREVFFPFADGSWSITFSASSRFGMVLIKMVSTSSAF